MAGKDGSSEEFVEDDSGEEGSSASFDSEEDEEDGDESDVFETPQKARKRAKASLPAAAAAAAAAEEKGPPSASSKGNPTKKPATATASVTAAAPAAAAAAEVAEASGVRGGSKGKGKAVVATVAAAESSEASSSTPTGDGAQSTPGGESVKDASPATVACSTPASGGASSTPATSTPSSAAKVAQATKSGTSRATGSGVAKTPKAAVSDYMLQSNRPFSCINVFDNLHKKIPKPMVQKLLDELVRDGTLKMQEYGKAKVYYANQEALPNGAGDASDGKLRELEQDAKELTSKLEVASKQAREAQARVQFLSSQPTDTALEEKLASTARELEQAEAKNASAKGQGHSVVAGGMKAAKADFNKFRALWVGRKRNAMDVVDMITDGMEKKPKVVMEMLGLEIDEKPIPARM